MSEGTTTPVDAVGAAELRKIIEDCEVWENEKKEAAERLKEVLAVAKSRGYDVAAIRKLLAIRKRDADAVAEEEMIVEAYKTALGM